MRYLLDTNICIYVIKNKPLRVLERFQACRPDDIGISAITLAELEFGVANSSRPQDNQEALNGFLAPLEILPFDHQAAVIYGTVRTHLQYQGTPIGAMDLLIAAHALSIPLTLVTNNEREFQRIPGLVVENWASSGTAVG